MSIDEVLADYPDLERDDLLPGGSQPRTTQRGQPHAPARALLPGDRRARASA
jgi:hypothetical protein